MYTKYLEVFGDAPRGEEIQGGTVQRAADLKGMSLSDFILGTAYDEAVHTIEAHEVIRLSHRDSVAFIAALERPPEPARKAMRRFRHARKYRAE